MHVGLTPKLYCRKKQTTGTTPLMDQSTRRPGDLRGSQLRAGQYVFHETIKGPTRKNHLQGQRMAGCVRPMNLTEVPSSSAGPVADTEMPAAAS